MKPLSIWCISDGRAGIERQTLAVAAALSEKAAVDVRTIRLHPMAPQVWLPPQFWPAPLAALPADERATLCPPWPDVWIANGRRSIPYSLQAKRWSAGKSVVVQLQDPRLTPALLAARFDVVAPPRHDGLTGGNVVSTLGAPVWQTKAQIAEAQAKFTGLEDYAGKRVLVILGGSSKRHRFSLARAQAILSDLHALSKAGFQLWITTSRRTPEPIVSVFRKGAVALNARFFANESEDGPNPYLAWLSMADAALVTEDSTNMITDAAFFGLPIHLLKLEGGDAKFDALHQSFIAHGAARWWQGALESWRYTPIKDAMTIADAIVQKLTNATA